jgi:hypothetical protein
VDIRGSFEDLIVQHIEITGRRRREDRDDYNRSLGIKRALNRSQEQSAIKLDGRNFQPAHAADFAQNYLNLEPGKLFFEQRSFYARKTSQPDGAGAIRRRCRGKLVGLLSHLQFKIVKSEMQVCLFQREL